MTYRDIVWGGILIGIVGMFLVYLYTANSSTRDIKIYLDKLNSNLCNPISRGALGEGIAEGIIRHIGLKEGVHYKKQDSGLDGRRPDFVFMLGKLNLNMDSKFPLTNYLNYINVEDELLKKDYLGKFLKDVKNRIKEITGKEYISVSEGTTDFAIVFIPNEHLFGFILDHDAGLLDYCYKNKIVLCSPNNLYMILSILYQLFGILDFDKFYNAKHLEFEKFMKEWNNYSAEAEKLDKKVEDVVDIVGRLSGIRTKSLERSFSVFQNNS